MPYQENSPQHRREALNKPRELDFLNERTQVYFQITPQAAEKLPIVTPEDLAARTERYRILLGSTQRVGIQSAVVTIAAVLSIPTELQYYTEGTNEILLNLPKIQEYVQQLRADNSSYSKLALVGDVHTHPITLAELDSGQHPTDASPDDVKDVAKYYEAGILSPNSPFLFGIAGPHINGETVYSYYRVIKRGQGPSRQYFCMRVGRK